MTDRRPPMTHATGAPVADNLNTMTAGPRGPAGTIHLKDAGKHREPRQIVERITKRRG